MLGLIKPAHLLRQSMTSLSPIDLATCRQDFGWLGWLSFRLLTNVQLNRAQTTIAISGIVATLISVSNDVGEHTEHCGD